MLEVLRQVLPVYLLMLLGAILRRVGMTRREHDDGILHLVFHVLYPCFIIDKILGSESVRDVSAVAWGIGTGFSLTVAGFGIAWVAAGLLRYERGTGKRTFALSAGVQNFGYTAIPVVEQMWVGTGAIAMLFVHNLGVELAIWSVGVMLISGQRQVPWRRLVNGPVVAVVFGLILVATGWDGMRVPAGSEVAEPGVLRTTMRWLGSGAFPVAIFVTGAVVMDLIGKERPTLRASLGGIVVRLAIVPAVILSAARFLPAPQPLEQVLIVQASMPAAVTPILLAKLYGGRPGVAVEIVVATTVVSMLTMPIVLLLGRQWLGYLP
ncbi:AEC family transporter [Haloferula sp. A504]|uniref:AEC family transporter n=1 Tax=Haloferula sp. A504 TaxID=3373601 RepID=UPI0031C2B4F0|nr:AEC family transporter [Verrucomicrobiaceae bacterium E54]